MKNIKDPKTKLVKTDILDVLLNQENTQNIIMFNNEGEQVEFMQICVVPNGEDLYCILKPTSEIENIASNEAVVFKVVQNPNEEAYLVPEASQEKSEKIFSEYERLITNELAPKILEKAKTLILNDVNLFKVFSRGKNKVDFDEYIILPAIHSGMVYVIIQDLLKDEGALVWKIVDYENGESRLEWEENDLLAFYLVERERESWRQEDE